MSRPLPHVSSEDWFAFDIPVDVFFILDSLCLWEHLDFHQSTAYGS